MWKEGECKNAEERRKKGEGGSVRANEDKEAREVVWRNSNLHLKRIRFSFVECGISPS
jgi:hypothetical protein